MKRLCLLVSFFFITLTFVTAQPVIDPSTSYVIKSGDTLWQLAGDKLHDPLAWVQLVEKNPFLKEKGRIFTDSTTKKTIAILKPGETLNVSGVTGIETKKIDTTPTIPVQDIGDSSIYIWMTLGALVLALLVVYFARKIELSNPIGSGEPIIPGGVADTDAHKAMSDRIQREHTGQNFSILHLVRGRGYGPMDVSYSDKKDQCKKLNGESVYRATARLENGVIKEFFMLQACGNDLKFGNILRYTPGSHFRFVPETEVTSPTTTAASTNTNSLNIPDNLIPAQKPIFVGPSPAGISISIVTKDGTAVDLKF